MPKHTLPYLLTNTQCPISLSGASCTGNNRVIYLTYDLMPYGSPPKCHPAEAGDWECMYPTAHRPPRPTITTQTTTWQHNSQAVHTAFGCQQTFIHSQSHVTNANDAAIPQEKKHSLFIKCAINRTTQWPPSVPWPKWANDTHTPGVALAPWCVKTPRLPPELGKDQTTQVRTPTLANQLDQRAASLFNRRPPKTMHKPCGSWVHKICKYKLTQRSPLIL